MSVLDGTKEALSYGAALIAIAERVSWQSEDIKRAVVRAVQEEHGLVPPDPDPVLQFNDSRDLTLHNQDKEIAALKAQLAEAQAAAEAAKVPAVTTA